MNGKLTTLLLTLLFTTIFSLNPTPIEDSITDLILRQEYEKAKEIAMQIDNKDSRNYQLLLISNSKMVDYESYAVDGVSFEKSTETYMKSLGKRWKKSDQLSYYYAMTKGMRGMSMIKRGSSLPGAMESKSSSKELEKLLKRYPNNISLLQSVGLSKYYMATSLKWLPIAGGKPESGLKLLRKALLQQGIGRYLTKQSMVWVYIDEKQYQKSEQTAQSILAKYPNNTLALRGLLQAQYRYGNYDEAEVTAKKLYTLSANRAAINRADQLSALVKQIQINMRKGDKSKARTLCNQALSLPLNSRERKIEWVQKHLKHVKKLKKDL